MPSAERDPERPDQSEPSRQRVREAIVERRIRAAMDEGAFDVLPHQGRRLPIEDDSLAGDWAMAHRLLKNAGIAPAWIEADKLARERLAELEGVIERAPAMTAFARTRARAELPRMVEATNRAITLLNAEAPTDRQHRRPLDLAAQLERFERAAERTSPPQAE